jgi:hypothetical protein
VLNLKGKIMYKKITHTIVEEHFDHPMANQIKKSMDKSKITTDEIFLESKFRSDTNSYIKMLQDKFSGMISSVTGTEEDLVTPFEDLFRDNKIDNLGNMTKPLYASEFGERINEAMRVYATSLLIIVQLLKYGKDITFASTRLNFASNDIAQVMSNFNNAWNYQIVNSLLTNLTAEMLKQIKAKLKKDAGADADAARNINQLFSTFESSFVNGIIAQHPDRFARPAPIATLYNSSKDIM